MGKLIRLLRYAVFELLKYATWIIRRLLQRIKNTVAHFDGGLEGGLLTAVLAIGEVFGELIPLTADAQAPPLERGRFVSVACDVSLGHDDFYWFGEWNRSVLKPTGI